MPKSCLRSPLSAVLALAVFISACTLPGALPASLPLLGPTTTPVIPPTQTATPTPLPTPTPPPTPTPIPAARIGAADQALFYGDWDRALAEYKSAYAGSDEPDLRSAALLGIGRARFASGDYAGATDALNELVDDYPESLNAPPAYFSLAQVYSALDRYDEAVDAYLNYLTRREGLIDAYVLELRGDALMAVQDYGSAINDYRAALNAPSLLSRFQIETKIAGAHAVAGDYETALALYTDLYNRAEGDFAKAQMDLHIGQVLLALNRPEEAYTAFQDAVTNYPTSFDSYQALLALVEAGVPVDELNRGIVDYYAGQYGVAIAAFDRYLAAAPADAGTAYYYYGLALRELGGYAEAVRQWEEIIQNYPEHRFWDDAWEQKAYTQWGFQDQFNQAIQTLLDFVAASPANPRAAEFLFDAAQVAERDEQLDRAAQLWERLAAEYPAYEKSMRGLFLAGICRYRLKDGAGALNVFATYLSLAASLDQRAAGYLWQGKVHELLGDQTAAQAAYQQAANTDPTGYYSERARDLQRGRAPFDPPQQFDFSRAVQEERLEAESWMRRTFNLEEGIDLSSPGPLQADPRYARGAELWELGLYDQARAEFEDLRLAVESDPANSYRLANDLIGRGLYRSGILAARQVLNLAGMDDAATMSAPEFFNHLRFGTYFAELVLPQAQANDLHPLLLFSIIRQESAFEGFVRSSAGARGLMQIIPATGQEIAADLGWPPDYEAEDLYRPLVSITLGASYLAKWRDHFGGDLYAALAAYNGGPGNSAVWRELSGGDLDLFLELIRFEETRNYVRGISEIFSIYRRLYDRSP